eukprot:142790-Rhodomonas_salina.2
MLAARYRRVGVGEARADHGVVRYLPLASRHARRYPNLPSHPTPNYGQPVQESRANTSTAIQRQRPATAHYILEDEKSKKEKTGACGL